MFNTKFIILISIIITLGYIFRNKLKDIYNDTTLKIKNIIQNNNNIEFVSNEILKKELSKNITNLFNLTNNTKYNATESMKIHIIIYLHKIFNQLKNIELVNEFNYVNEYNFIIFEPIIIKCNYNKQPIHIKLDLIFVNNTDKDLFIGSESLDNNNGSYNIINLDIINYDDNKKIENHINNNKNIDNNSDDINDLIPNDIIITEHTRIKNNDTDIINDLITNDINITEYTKKTDSLNDLISNDIHLTEHEESSIDSLIKDNIDYNYI